jgi:hypothetical protein
LRQERLNTTDSRLALSAELALNIMANAGALRQNIEWATASLAHLSLFRASVAVCVNFSFFMPRMPNMRALPNLRPHG